MSAPWILVVEDQLIVARSIEMELQRMGYQTLDPVPTGEEAVKTALQIRPDLILMDVNLAGTLDGIEAARIIRQQAEIPVIFLTAYSEDEIVKRAAVTEPFGYLVKPFQPRELRTNIEMALYKARSERTLKASHRRYAQLFEQMLSGFALHEIITDDRGQPSDYRFLEVNPAFERLTGLRAADLRGRTVLEAMPETEPVWIERYGRVALTGEPIEFEDYSAVLDRTYEVRAFSPEPGKFAVLFNDISERRRHETEIRRNRDFLRSVIESLPHPFMVINAEDQSIVMGNAASLRDAPPSATTCHQLNHRTDRPCGGEEFPCPLQEVVRTRAPARVEHEHLAPNGSPRMFEVHGYPILNEKGEVAQMIEYSLDITDRKRAEEALRESEERYRSLAENLGEGVGLVDGDEIFQYANPAAEAIFGVPPGGLIGRRLDAFTTPEQFARLRERTAERKDGRRGSYEMEIIRADGGRRVLHVTATPRWEGDRFIGAFAIFADKTDEHELARAVERSEATFRAVVERASDAILLAEEGRVVLANRAAASLFGRPDPLALVDTEVDRLLALPADDLEATPDGRHRVVDAGGTRLDGSTFPAGVSRSRFTFAGAERYLYIVRDLTETKALQRILQDIALGLSAQAGGAFFESLARYLARLLNADLALIGAIEPGAEDRVRTLGVVRDGQLAENYTYRLEGTPCEQVTQREVCLFQEGVSERFPQDAALRNMGMQAYAGILLRGGDSRALGVLAVLYRSPMVNADLVGSMLEIFATRAAAELERMRFEAHLLRLRTAVEQMAESVVVTDAGGAIEYVNPAFTALTGYASAEVLGRNPRLLKSGEHLPEFYAAMWAELGAGRPWLGFMRNRRKDGTLFEEEAAISPILDRGGALTGFVAVKRDVTAERALQKRLQERERLAAVGELAGAIAHEIKNPLFAITGGLQVLEMELPMNGEQQQYLKTIMGEGMRIDRLIRQLRAYSRPVPIDKRPTAVDELLAAAVLAMRGPAQQKGVAILYDAPAAPVTTDADPDKLTQVFINLLQNALEASPVGTEIRSSLERSGEALRVTVEDRGKGIHPEALGRLFDPLFTTKAGNTGLGLYISRTIVIQHGGEIAAENRPDGGARFIVSLPLGGRDA